MHFYWEKRIIKQKKIFFSFLATRFLDTHIIFQLNLWSFHHIKINWKYYVELTSFAFLWNHKLSLYKKSFSASSYGPSHQANPKKCIHKKFAKKKSWIQNYFSAKITKFTRKKSKIDFFYLSNFNSVTSLIDLKCVRLNFKRINVLTSFIQSSRFPLNTFFIRFFLFLKHKPYS